MNKESVNKLEGIRKRVDLLMSMHSYLCDEFTWVSNTIKFVGLISTLALIVLLIPSSEDILELASPLNLYWLNSDSYKLFLILLSAINAGLFLYSEIFSPTIRANEHRKAVEHYFLVKNQIRIVENDEEIKAETIQKLEKGYSEDENIPKIPASKFLSLRKRYLADEVLNEGIKKNPCIPMWLLKLKVTFNCTCRNES